MTLKYQQYAERRETTEREEGRGRQMRVGQQQVVVMETGEIVTRLTSTVFKGGRGVDAEKASMSR